MPVYTERNRSAAVVILANPQRYGGALLEWARLVMAKQDGGGIVQTDAAKWGSSMNRAPRHNPLFSNTSGPVGRLNARG